jgi:hypothetical protein
LICRMMLNNCRSAGWTFFASSGVIVTLMLIVGLSGPAVGTQVWSYDSAV